ncbi:MAG: hypothetical protein ABTQ31_12880 [Rhizobiaceae bacterium]
MVARPSAPFRSANAGEISSDARGRIDIKQYYAGGLAFKNVEPVPQGGFRQMGGSRRMGRWRKPLASRAITGPALIAGPHTGTQTVWTGTVAGTVAAVLVTNLGISAGSATFDVEADVAGVWTKIAGPFAVTAGTAVTRFAAFAPGAQKVATGLRIRATFSGSATVSGAAVTAFYEDGIAERPRAVKLTTDAGDAILGFASAGIVDFFTRANGHVGAARLPALAADMLPDLGFYAEGKTIGVFYPGQFRTQRLLLSGALCDWRVDNWPYDPVPKADLGGTYPKTDDVWEIFIRWIEDAQIYIGITVNGESMPSLALKSGGTLIGANAATSGDWADLAAAIEDELQDLPGLGPGVTVVVGTDPGLNNSVRMVVTFGGDLAGEEYEFSALVTNTSDASALAYHTEIGKTDFEEVFSAGNGWPGAMALMQDRAAYYRIPAITGATAISRIGEYFDLEVEASADDAARFDKLRTQTSETIVHMREDNYFLVWTDEAAYFIPNRTIERNTPLNFVRGSEVGAQPNAAPVDLDGTVHYIAINEKGIANRHAGGNQLMVFAESAVTSQTSFQADPVSLLASHLVAGVIRTAEQAAASDLDATKGWLMRADGRLVAGQFIRNQEIVGFCEWIAAAQGQVREIGMDGHNQLWLAVERAAGNTLEIYDTRIFLQDAVDATPDLAGAVTGLDYEDGAELWAVADGFVLGPFTASAGAIDLGNAYTAVLVGRWQAPRFETMPQVFVTPGDDVIFRPGRIHTVEANIMDTTSIAIGANGEAARNVPLLTTNDPVDAPMPGKTQLLQVTPLLGSMVAPTAVFTQTRPGRLRVRDYALGAKL